MTRTFLAAVALTLGAVAAAHAGGRLGRPEWATLTAAQPAQATQSETLLPPPGPAPGPAQPTPGTAPAAAPTPLPSLPSMLPSAPSAPAQPGPVMAPPALSAPSQTGPATLLPPHPAHEGQDCGCAAGCAGNADCGSSCWQRLWGWISYHGERTPCCGGCCGHGCGGCCGHGHCTSCDGYHCFPPLYMYFPPCKAGAGYNGSGCTSCAHPGFWRNIWATGHRMFSLPTGCGCPGIQ